MNRGTAAVIDLGAVRQNLERINQLAPASKVMAVIKADAYGHGLTRLLPALDGADALAVATISEAVKLRMAGYSGELVLLEGVTSRKSCLIATEHQLGLVFHSEEQLATLKSAGTTLSARPWIKLDTGMHRLGFPFADAESIQMRLEPFAGEYPIGLMTHFACADDPDNSLTEKQLDRFLTATRALEGPKSAANSAALLNHSASQLDWVRPGLLVYGLSPNTGQVGADLGLAPVMQMESRLIAVRNVKKGESVGYGAEFTCITDRRIGTAAIGYGDGYPLKAASGTPLLVNGKQAALAGRVSMDMIGIDLTNAPDAKVGDKVVLWGPDLPVETVAAHIGTIPYDLTCGVTRRVQINLLNR